MSDVGKLSEKLLYRPENGFRRMDRKELERCGKYCEGYKEFLGSGKTERECAGEAVALAKAAGFREYHRGDALKSGDKIYRVNRGKAVFLAVLGTDTLDRGANIAAAHIDAPRLDLKPSPLYEDSELAYLKTHYYGGIRKYQWVTVPLELHGVVALKNGKNVNVRLGADEGDPQLVIEDLLPHLGAEQSKKPLGEAIPAELLNLLVGSEPLAAGDDKKNRVKLMAMSLLYEKYGFTEEDFISAELSAVPAYKPTDIGFDRSMIGAYGHDDRVCAYAALRAVLDAKKPGKTCVCALVDKEEIGSEGVSGMQSCAFETFMADLCAAQDADMRECFENSFCLSADVTAAFDPNFAEAYEKRNSARLNYGVGLCKYTGARGKSGASDASAEVVAYIRRLFDENGVVWQMAELGKVDYGGGGTVAMYMAKRNIDTLDAGVPVLAMHAPFETVAKLDCYMTYKGIKALYDNR
jgi:aspartyl aminopeptidase